MKKIPKRLWICFLLLIIAITMIPQEKVYANVYNVADEKIWIDSSSTFNEYTGVEESALVADLKEKFGYEGDGIYAKMKFVTTVSIQSKVWYDGNYILRIGNSENNVKKSGGVFDREFTYEQLQIWWGYEGEENDIVAGETKWDVIIIVDSKEDDIFSDNGTSNKYYIYYANTIYSGTSYELGEKKEISDGNHIGYDQDTMVEALVDYTEDMVYNLGNVAADVISWVQKFLDNWIGTVITLALDVARTALGDIPQTIINIFQTATDGTMQEHELEYDYETLSEEDSNGAHNKYTDVSGDVTEEGYVREITIDESTLASDDYYFEDTKIPIISVDLYSMAMGSIDAFDVNFLTGQETNNNSTWIKLRNIVAAIIRASLYISAGVLITALIWHGVQIVLSSINNDVQNLKKHKEGLNSFVSGVIMLVGTVVIMAVSINAYKIVLGDIEEESDNKYKLPIRVHVINTTETLWDEWFGKNEQYSFSTNVIGYVRFMAQISNPDRVDQKAEYTIVYIILVWVNIIAVVVMFVRVLGMWLLSIVGPIIAVAYAMSGSPKVWNYYKLWVWMYIILAMVQLVFALAYRIILSTFTQAII